MNPNFNENLILNLMTENRILKKKYKVLQKEVEEKADIFTNDNQINESIIKNGIDLSSIALNNNKCYSKPIGCQSLMNDKNNVSKNGWEVSSEDMSGPNSRLLNDLRHKVMKLNKDLKESERKRDVLMNAKMRSDDKVDKYENIVSALKFQIKALNLIPITEPKKQLDNKQNRIQCSVKSFKKYGLRNRVRINHELVKSLAKPKRFQNKTINRSKELNNRIELNRIGFNSRLNSYALIDSENV